MLIARRRTRHSLPCQARAVGRLARRPDGQLSGGMGIADNWLCIGVTGLGLDYVMSPAQPCSLGLDGTEQGEGGELFGSLCWPYPACQLVDLW